VIEVLDDLHAGGEASGAVIGAVIDEEDVFGIGFEALCCVAIDFGLGFCELQGVGEEAKVEVREPRHLSQDARGHFIAQI